MKFSVLMSVYHRDQSSDLREALQSIFNQTLLPTQVLLVEDGLLTHDLYEVIDSFTVLHSEIDVLKLDENVGLGEALQSGLGQCKYNIVARFDADDINDKYRFEKQINYLKNNPNVAVVGSQIREFYVENDEKKFVANRIVPTSYEKIKEFSKKRNPLNHMSVVFRKDAIYKVGGYKTAIGFEDYYLWLRLLKEGYIIENMDEFLVNVRVGKNMIARRGGIKYTLQAVKIKTLFLKEKLIPFNSYLISVLSHLVVGIMPRFLREYIYYNLLHK